MIGSFAPAIAEAPPQQALPPVVARRAASPYFSLTTSLMLVSTMGFSFSSAFSSRILDVSVTRNSQQQRAAPSRTDPTKFLISWRTSGFSA